MTPPTVAVCDDHRLFGDSLAVVLRSEGCRVVAVTDNPEQLLDVLRQDPVDVCVLDLNFGRDEAAEQRTDAISAITTISPACKVVVLTGDQRDSAMTVSLQAGAAAFVLKTADVDVIVGAVRAAHLGTSTAQVAQAHAPPHRRQVDQLGGWLTPRELEVLAGLVRGDDTRTIARQLGIAYSTARSHVQNVLVKTGAHSQHEAAVLGVRHRLVDPTSRDRRRKVG